MGDQQPVNPDRIVSTNQAAQPVLNPLINLQAPQSVAVPTTSQSYSDRIDIQRLKGNNWAIWKWQLQNLLDTRGLTDALTSSKEARGTPKEVTARQIISSSLD